MKCPEPNCSTWLRGNLGVDVDIREILGRDVDPVSSASGTLEAVDGRPGSCFKLEEVRTSETILKINGESELSSGEGFVGESSEETSVMLNLMMRAIRFWELIIRLRKVTSPPEKTGHDTMIVDPLLVDICLAFLIVSPP